MHPFRTLDSLRQSLATSLGFGAVSSMVSLQLPILTELLQQAQNQLWHDIKWQHLLRVHTEILGEKQKVLDLPDDYHAGISDRVFITPDFESVYRRCVDDYGVFITPDFEHGGILDGEFITPNKNDRNPRRVVRTSIKPCAKWTELSRGIPRNLPYCYAKPQFFEVTSRYDADHVQMEFYPVPPFVKKNSNQGAYMVRIEYYAKPDRFTQANDIASVPDDLLLTLAIIMGKGHYRQPDVGLYADRFEKMLRQYKADNFASDGEYVSSQRILSDPYLTPVRGI